MSYFKGPYGVAVDSTGTMIYIADTSNNMIKVAVTSTMAPTALPTSFESVKSTVCTVMVATVAGNVTAGLKDGSGLKASFNAPYGVTLHSDMHIYIPDQDNKLIRMYNVMTKNITTVKVTGSL
jgi:hypothetical protein